MRWIGVIGLPLGVWALGWPDTRWAAIIGQLALGCGAVTAWALASDTVLHSGHKPHRIGGWFLRALWASAIVTVPFSGWAVVHIRWASAVIGLTMLFSFIGRLHRRGEQQKLASISDLVAAFGCVLGLALWLAAPIHPLPLRIALIVLAGTGAAVLARLPTSEAQMSDVDHHRST